MGQCIDFASAKRRQKVVRLRRPTQDERRLHQAIAALAYPAQIPDLGTMLCDAAIEASEQ